MKISYTILISVSSLVFFLEDVNACFVHDIDTHSVFLSSTKENRWSDSNSVSSIGAVDCMPLSIRPHKDEKSKLDIVFIESKKSCVIEDVSNIVIKDYTKLLELLSTKSKILDDEYLFTDTLKVIHNAEKRITEDNCYAFTNSKKGLFFVLDGKTKAYGMLEYASKSVPIENIIYDTDFELEDISNWPSVEYILLNDADKVEYIGKSGAIIDISGTLYVHLYSETETNVIKIRLCADAKIKERIDLEVKNDPENLVNKFSDVKEIKKSLVNPNNKGDVDALSYSIC